MNLKYTYRPSNLHRRKACPGSAREESKCAPEPDSEFAAEGRTLHECIADPARDRACLTQAQRETLNRYEACKAEVIQRVEAEVGSDCGFATEFHEQLMKFWGDSSALFTGTPDLVRAYSQRALLVIDAKFGFVEVTAAESNLQLAAYVVMAWDDFPVQTVYVAIIQPRLARDRSLTLAKYDASEIEAVRSAIVAVIEACEKDDAPLVPSEDACRHCAARLSCPALDAGVTSLKAAPRNVQTIVGTMPFADLERLYTCVQLAKSKTFGGVIADEMKSRAEQGSAPGWELRSNAGNREITDALAVYGALKSQGLASSAEFMAMCKISVTDLEEFIRSKLPEVQQQNGKMRPATKEEARAWMHEHLGGYITRTEKEPSLVRVK